MVLSVDTLTRLRTFFVEHCAPPSCLSHPDGPSLAPGGSQQRQVWVQEVDCMRLLHVCPSFGAELFTRTLATMDVLRGVCVELCNTAERVIDPAWLSVRLTHLPAINAVLPSLPPPQGQLVQVCGSIVRMTAKRVVPYANRLMCPRCHGVTESLTNPFDRSTMLSAICERPDCKKEPLQVVGQIWMDYAECRLQQRSNQSGRLPRSVLVTLDDELSTKCNVGQFVEVIGMLVPRWKHVFPLSRPTIEPVVWAINVVPMEAYRGAALAMGGSAPRRRPGAARNREAEERSKFNPETFYLSFAANRRRRGVALVKAVCPHLSGLFAPRMAVLLCALGGASTAGKTSMHVRSTIHCLFVGDPSTGKSQLLRFAASISPRSTSTTGMGSTSAGLTVAATKEQGEWVLEPGALVLSDGGACIIDELRTVSTADRATLHEAMEQQTISVAKGGLVTKLRTACSVMSACNPPPRRNGRTEVGVGGPLLSRFDFIFLLWDTPQADTDARIADHMLSCNVAHYQPEPVLDSEELAAYLWWVRRQYSGSGGPLLSDNAADLLARYFEIQQRRGVTASLDDAVPVTVRLLESLVRITQAHAKLHLQPVCTVEDAAMAIFLMERTAHSLKCPLQALGDDLYSSSRELDEVFLRSDEAGLEAQQAVLAALVQVVLHYRTYSTNHHRGSGGDPSHPTTTSLAVSPPPSEADQEAKEATLLSLFYETDSGGDCVPANTLLAQRKEAPPLFVEPASRTPDPSLTREDREYMKAAAAARLSAMRLAKEVASPSRVPRSVTRYHDDVPSIMADTTRTGAAGVVGTVTREPLLPRDILLSQMATTAGRRQKQASSDNSSERASRADAHSVSASPLPAYQPPDAPVAPSPLFSQPQPSQAAREGPERAPNVTTVPTSTNSENADELSPSDEELFMSDAGSGTQLEPAPSASLLPSTTLARQETSAVARSQQSELSAVPGVKRKRSAEDIMNSLRFSF